MRYTTAVVNILTSYSMLGEGRFIYLSSQEVFDGSYANDIPETAEITAKGLKAPAVSQGEGICNNYREMQGGNTIILRPDHIYGMSSKEQTEGALCFEMCLEALRTGKISANSRKRFSMLYLNDAVELIYKVIEKENPEYSCYHISSMEEIDETGLAEIVRDKMGGQVALIDHSVGENQRLVLDGRRYQEEFGQDIFTHYDKGVDSVVQYMKKYSDHFVKTGDIEKKWGGSTWHTAKKAFKTMLPFLESFVCFILFYMLNQQAVGSQYFNKLDFYLLYVLLFAIVHGQQSAIFTALLSIVGYCLQQSQVYGVYWVMLDYNTYVWIAQLFIVGMGVGYKLDQYGPEEVLFYESQMLGHLMDSRDVAIYLVVNGDYARLYSVTSADARRLGGTIQYTAMEEMYRELKEGRVFVNKMKAEDLPLLASAVFSEGEMQLILMIWGIPWQRMTLAETNRLTIIGMLVQNAMVRASRYLESLRAQRYMEGTNVLNKEAFTKLVFAFWEARKKGLTECALLEIQADDQNYEQAAEVLSKNIRSTDYLGVLENGKLYALMSNTNDESAEGVIKRFQSAGYESLLKGAEV